MVLLDKDCTGDALTALIRELLGDAQRLENMGKAAKTLAKPLATETIAEIIMELVYDDKHTEDKDDSSGSYAG